MPQNLTIRFDPLKCTGCGLCQRNCPTGSISLVSGKAQLGSNRCLSCGHCQAMCPVGAISGALPTPLCSRFESFSPDLRYLPPGNFDLAALVNLMASRRSIRRFSSKGVEPGILRDLVRIGVSAPSATNSQCWTFTIIPDGPSVHALCGPVAEYFRRVCRLSSFAPLRYILRFLGKPELDQFHRGYRPFILDCLEKWDNAGVDPFFRGAQAAILIGSRPGASRHGADDAQLATQNILLAAHAMGLGTCLVGLALAAFRDDSSAYELLKIPREEKIHSVIAVGYPETRYQSVTGRAEPLVRTTRIP